MDILWSPWRFGYVSQDKKDQTCVFCARANRPSSEDREHLILHRGSRNLVILNLFPYTTGHTLIVPYAHVAGLEELPTETLTEMMTLAQKVQGSLKITYNPDGYNLGMNLGKSAGAGVADHVHLHVLPRWVGEASFITVVGETRVSPEDLGTTYGKLVKFFR